MNYRLLTILTFLILVLFISSCTYQGKTIKSINKQQANTTDLNIITYGLGNTQEWKDSLQITGLRMGSSYDVKETIKNARIFVKDHNLKKVFIATYTPINETGTLYFSNESLYFQELEEVGIDDFVSAWYYEWKWNQTLLNNFINNLKYYNPNLKFGITLYEDQVDLHDLSEDILPKLIKERIDYVHLFIHYRKNSQNYEKYFNKIKSMFPNAKIITGSYAYDRIDYISCDQSLSYNCSLEEELYFFNISIAIQSYLFKKSETDSIEFVPAYFGNEENMPYFDDSLACKPERKQE